MRRIAILTSGGDTPGMNTCIHTVVRTAKANGLQTIGIFKGYAGLIEGRLAEIRSKDVEGIVSKGGTILKTARCEEMKTKEGQEQAHKVLRAFGIDGLVVVGGDGSFKGAQCMSHLGVPTIGLPGTIDNDLAYTDYTIGFDTAVNNAVDEIGKIRDTMISHERIGIVEVMGRNCGDIALRAGVASEAEFILLPEVPFDVDDVCEKIQNRRIKGNMTSIVVLSEGAGKGEALANYVRAKTGFDVKSIVLGYVQRGGTPTEFDSVMATKMSTHAVRLLMDGIGGRVVGIQNNAIIDMDIDEALAMKKVFDFDLYNDHLLMNSF